MDSSVVLRFRSVFPFIRRGRTTPGLLLSSRSRLSRHRSAHRRVAGAISPMAYTLDLPTAGRRRASPVMSQDHFLQAATHIITRVVHRRRSVLSAMGGCQGIPSASFKGGNWRTRQAAVPTPEVSLPGPFTTMPSPVPPTAPPWLHTSAGDRGVRAESSERTRIRSGRLRLHATSFLGLTVYSRGSARGRLSPEPLRLTRPFGACGSRPIHLEGAGARNRPWVTVPVPVLLELLTRLNTHSSTSIRPLLKESNHGN